MSPRPSIVVLFQNDSRVFFPSQPIIGYVEVYSEVPISCKGVVVQLKGGSEVHFSQQENDNSHHNSNNSTNQTHGKKTVHYRSTENYYTMNMRLWNASSPQMQLPAGKHQFPFSLTLPSTTPSSFEGKYGHIRHACKATIELTGFFSRNVKCVIPFSVISIYDLNTDFTAQNPLMGSEEKTLCCLCCASGPMSILVNISKTGYVPGENIYITAECVNKSNRNMNCSKAELIQEINYQGESIGKRASKKEIRTVCSIKRPEIVEGGTDIWNDEPMRLPPLPPSKLPGCDNIDIRYLLRFTLEPSGPSTSLSLDREIIIGTIPLRNNFNVFTPGSIGSVPPQIGADVPPAYQPPPYPGQPSAPPSQFPGLAMYPDLPPPSYNDCTFGLSSFEYNTSEDEDEDDKDNHSKSAMKFTPRYVSYNMQPSAPVLGWNNSMMSNTDNPNYPVDAPMNVNLIQ